MKNPKAKGGQFERRMCRHLSLWVSDFERDDVFWRSAMSGGRATVRQKKGELAEVGVGDITAVHPLGNALLDRFVIEAKHYRDVRFAQFVCRSGGPIAEWWARLREEACSRGRLPFLIFRQNSMPVMAGLSREGRLAFDPRQAIPVRIYVPKLNLYLHDIEDLTTIPFPTIRKRWESRR